MTTPTTPDEHDQREATTFTPLLRASSEPRWERLRSRLGKEGIEPEDVAVGTLFPDDPSMEFGVVVSKDGRAFAFDFDFLKDPQGNRISSRADAWVVNFRRLSNEERETYERPIRTALWFLSREGATSE